MAEENYNDYLAARLLTENKPVTYRLLSRALKVNVNVAKRMLFDFHQNQNTRNPNSIHATYLLSGTRQGIDFTNGANGRDRDDVAMRSSPFPSSMPERDEATEEPVKKATLLLVREEELEKTRREFEKETSVHVYSLEPGPIQDLNVLLACNHEIDTELADEDPLERWRVYGSIHNPYVKRRTAKYAAPAVSTSQVSAKPVAQLNTAATTKEKNASTPALRGSASVSTSGRSTPQPVVSSSSLKRSDSKAGARKDITAGDIFKSFSKAKSKPKEIGKSQESSTAPVEDEPMQGMSEDEGDLYDEPEVKIDEEKNQAARRVREDRAERLRKMMEDDDEDMPDAPIAAKSQLEATPTATADTTELTDNEATIVVQDGRRRGRRRVMKKKKVKDEDGYLVTKEEAVWESFSEDEPAPKKLKSASFKTPSAAKGKATDRKGQGSIASFFKKA